MQSGAASAAASGHGKRGARCRPEVRSSRTYAGRKSRLMTSTFSAVFLHIVFSTKGRTADLAGGLRTEVYAYLMGIARRRGVTPIRVGGWFDHVHLLLQMPPKTATSDLVRDLKSNSSSWIHRRWPGRRNFARQDGFASFSVSPGNLPRVKRYIEKQASHHEGRSFEGELKDLFKSAGYEFDDRFLG